MPKLFGEVPAAACSSWSPTFCRDRGPACQTSSRFSSNVDDVDHHLHDDSAKLRRVLSPLRTCFYFDVFLFAASDRDAVGLLKSSGQWRNFLLCFVFKLQFIQGV